MSRDSGLGSMTELPFRSMTIVYVQKDEEWSTYILKHFQFYKKLKLNIHQLNVTALGPGEYPPELEASVRESYVTMLLTSSYFLTYMEENASWFPLMLRKRDRDITSVVSALLHVTDDDIRDVADKNGYDYDTWELLEIDIGGTNMKDCVIQTLGFIDKNTDCKREKMKTLRRRSHLSGSDDSAGSIESPTGFVQIEMVPTSVNGAGETIALLFKDKIEGNVSVSIYGTIDEITTSSVNPYCVTFVAPEVCGRYIRLQVNVDGIRQKMFKLSNTLSTPKFNSVELLCHTLKVSNKDELDKKLSSTFKSSICANKSAKMIYDQAIESIYSAKPTKEDGEYPTVVHWAAANGLKELCSALLSAPGSEAACRIRNFQGNDPAELARNNGHQELSEFLMKFVSGDDYMTRKELFLKLSDLDGEFRADKPPALPPRTKGRHPPSVTRHSSHATPVSPPVTPQPPPVAPRPKPRQNVPPPPLPKRK